MTRPTEEVIIELKSLIYSKGFIYSFCFILFEDFHHDLNQIHKVDYKSKLSVKECSLIIGFLVQKEIDFTIPANPEEVILQKERTYELMREFHDSINSRMIPKFKEIMELQEKGQANEDDFESRMNFFVKDQGMVEPMFYAGDGVYDFQYLEFLESKYKYDSNWLIENRGIDLNKIKAIPNQIKLILRNKASKVNLINLKERFAKAAKDVRKKIKDKFPTEIIDESERQMFISATFYQYFELFPIPLDTKKDNTKDWDSFYKNLLDLFIVTPKDFKNIDDNIVDSFFKNFSFSPACNEDYEGVGHFNIINSRPLVKLENEQYFIPINFLVAESMYESPFYWMFDDKTYRDTLAKHRGDVGEEIAFNFLSKVFGKENTFKSINVVTKKGERETDIDVLCLLGNKAVVVQVKSKKLTLTSKRGDFEQLSKDFNGAIQDAYDQGIVSRNAILNKTAKLIDESGNKINLTKDIDEVYILGLTTENYPSLVHQVQTMLKKETKDPFPLFLSVFDLELLVHYLNDPYDFLYYVRQRIALLDYFRADEEIVYLGYHLTKKLCRIEDFNYGLIDNYYAGIIDRNYFPYKLGVSHLLSESDDPIHNRWKDPHFDKFIEEIKSTRHPKATDIVFHLLDWSGDGRKDVLDQMKRIKNQSQIENTTKSIATSTPPEFGLSYIVMNAANPIELSNRVETYATQRKYLSKCNAWLGIGSYSESSNLIDFIFYKDELWELNEKFEIQYKEELTRMKKTPFTPINGTKKIGRNDLCPCRSGKKYKRCCIN